MYNEEGDKFQKAADVISEVSLKRLIVLGVAAAAKTIYLQTQYE